MGRTNTLRWRRTFVLAATALLAGLLAPLHTATAALRPVAGSPVPWAPPPWTTVGAASADQRTPDLATLLQLVIARTDWVSGNALCSSSPEPEPARRSRTTAVAVRHRCSTSSGVRRPPREPYPRQMLRALVAGIVAGYGIAIPVGAIAVLIVETGMRCGFRCAAVAGAGAATADLLYASAATLGGAVIASAVEAASTPFRYGSAAVLAVMAINGLRKAHRPLPTTESTLPDRSQLVRTYGKFLGLTIINPLTVIYFTVFVVGMGVAATLSALEAVVFALGAFAASLSWQTLLAGVGAAAHRRLPAGFRTGATIVGNLIVLGLAVVVMVR